MSAQAPRYDLRNDLQPLVHADVHAAPFVDFFRQHFKHALFDTGTCQELQGEHPYLRTWRLSAEDVWQQLAIVAFPYVDAPQWQALVSGCFQREGHWWQQWCAGRAAQETSPRLTVPPLWQGLDQLSPVREYPGATRLFGVHRIEGVPVLVRPYLPWPTIAERPMSGEVRTAVLSTLQGLPAARNADTFEWWRVPDTWVISDGQLALPVWWSLADAGLLPALRGLLTGSSTVGGAS
jgi:hypothetical protein